MVELRPHLAQYVRGGIEYIIDSHNGEVFVTIEGYAKLSGLPVGEIAERLNDLTEGIEWREAQIFCTGGDGKKDVILIPAESVFDWLLADRPGVARIMAKEVCCASTYFYRLAGQNINRIELAQSMLDALKQQEKDIEALKSRVNIQSEIQSENWKNQGALNDKIQASFVNLEQRLAVDAPENYYTVPQYLEEIRKKKQPVSLSEVIQMNAAAINVCNLRKKEIRETVSNRLGTVYAFPFSILQELERELYNERKS